MRIALFVETYVPYINGVVTHVKILKEGLEQQGHQVLVVCSDGQAKEHYIKDGILHCPGHISKKFYGYSLSLPFSSRRMELLREFDPDVCHIHTEFGIGLFGAHAAKKLGKPLVYTLHTMYDDYLYYVSPKAFLGLTKKFSRWYVRRLAERSSAVLGPSKKCVEYFRSCGLQKEVHVIPNSVELDLFHPSATSEEQRNAVREQYHIPAGDMVACFVGRMGREKSVDVLLDYWKETITPEDHIHLLLIGDGPQLPEWRVRAQEEGLEDRVTFCGKVMHKDIPPYFAICDAYVTASLSEAHSISMLEGMASGLPVLQRLDPLNAYQVQQGGNGYLFETAQEMAAHLREIRDLSPQEKQALKERVIDSVKESGAKQIANCLLKVYQEVVNSRPTEEM